MLVDVFYKPNDVVTYRYPKRNYCSFCSGIGTIFGNDGSECNCPKCNGVGYFELSEPIIEEAKAVIDHCEVEIEDESYNVYYIMEQYPNNDFGVRIKVPQEDIIGKWN